MDRLFGFLSWYGPVLAYYFAWPILKRRRAYSLSAGVLLLTPMPYGMGPALLPSWLALCFQLIWENPGQFTQDFLPVFLAAGSLTGFLTWLLTERLSPPFSRLESGDLRLTKRTISNGQAKQSVSSNGLPHGPWGDFRQKFSCSLLRRLWMLLLLAIAAIAYGQLCDLAWRIPGLL